MRAFANDIESMPSNCKVLLVIRRGRQVKFLFLVQLEDYIPGVEEFYRKNHSGRKLQWHHLMSNGVVGALFFRSSFFFLSPAFTLDRM